MEIMGKKKPDDDSTMDVPKDFRCPISMELMEDPVTISTGLTYERKNIEKWFFGCKKTSCPATMQGIHDFNLTPNHTLKRLIFAWKDSKSESCPSPLINHEELVQLLDTIESTPFKVNPLKKLGSMVETGDGMKIEFKKAKGVEVLLKIIVEILVEGSDFVAFRACEEAIGVLHLVISSSEELDDMIQLFSQPDVMKSMATMLQRGSAEARFHTISIFQKLAKSDFNWNFITQDQGIDFFKSILEMVSDEMYRKASSCALEVLIDITDSSKKSRLKVIEAGAICVLLELLPDSNKSKSEKIMLLIKLLCECADGRLAFVEHGLGVAAISNQMSNIPDAATKLGVRILWLISNSHPSERVLEEMLIFGAVKKLVAMLHIGGRSSTKDKVVKILKLQANSWRRYPCFPNDLKDYLGIMGDSS